MSKIVLYADLLSQPCRSLVWTMVNGNIPYELKKIQLLKLEQRSEEFRKINPFAKVPVLQVDGKVILESHTQLRFLAQKYKLEQLYPPADTKLFERTNVDSYLDWHHTNCRLPLYQYFSSMYIKPRLNVKTNPLKVEEEAKNVSKSLYLIQKYWLNQGNTPYINSDGMTLADITAFCELSQLNLIKYNLEEYPHIKEWMNRMELQKGFKESHIEYHKILSNIQQEQQQK